MNRWIIDAHPPGDFGLALGVYGSRKSAGAKAAAIEREAARQGIDVEVDVYPLDGATSSAADIIAELAGDY